MRIALIANPAAGNARGPWQSPVRAKLAELGEVELFAPESPQGTTSAARDAEARGFDLIIPAGGDGTIHRVINGLRDSKTEIGILPVGTANDLASHLDVPKDRSPPPKRSRGAASARSMS